MHGGDVSIFDQIRNAFARGEEAAVRPVDKPADAAPGVAADHYTVRSGDTLWKIAVEVYGDGARYAEIFEANRDLLDSPDRILPGQELRLPPA